MDVAHAWLDRMHVIGNSSQQPCCRHSEHRRSRRTLRVLRALLCQGSDGCSGEKRAAAGVQDAMRICRTTWQLPTHDALRAGGPRTNRPVLLTVDTHSCKVREGRGTHVTAGQLRVCACVAPAVLKMIAGVVEWPASGRVDIEAHQTHCNAAARRTFAHAVSDTGLFEGLRCMPYVRTRAGIV